MPSPPSTLSVVIPTHDTRELTLACVRSLDAGLEVRLEIALEIIVVDDASRDGTAEALSDQHPAVVVLRNETPVRFTKAANLGMARARGDLLLLLNSDTEVQPGALDALLEAFRRDPKLGAAGAALHYPDGSPQWSGGAEPSLLWLFGMASGLPALLGRLAPWRRIKPVGALPGAVDWVTGAALAIRREAWEQVGPLDEGYLFYGQDLDLGSRLRKAGWRVEIVPGFRVLHHHGATIGKDMEPTSPSPPVRGRGPGRGGTGSISTGRQNLELLWLDLLRWARLHRGEAWAARASRLLRAGAALRLLGRSLAAPFVTAERRPAWKAESLALLNAARSVGRDPKLAIPPRAG